jgi:hypothetical protein
MVGQLNLANPEADGGPCDSKAAFDLSHGEPFTPERRAISRSAVFISENSLLPPSDGKRATGLEPATSALEGQRSTN